MDIHPACWEPKRTPSMTLAAPSRGMNNAIRGMTDAAASITAMSFVKMAGRVFLQKKRDAVMMTPAIEPRVMVLWNTEAADLLSEVPR